MLHLHVHPENPQPRTIRQAAEQLKQGAVLVYPTETAYAFGCAIGQKNALEKIAGLRRLSAQHQYTLLCRDLSEIASFARVENAQYRWLKAHTPSACTFILPASSEVPRRLQHAKKKTIGIRVSDFPICRALLTELGEPLLTSSLILPNQDLPLDDPDDILAQLGKQVDVFIDCGISARTLTTIVDLTGDSPVLVRQGATDMSDILA